MKKIILGTLIAVLCMSLAACGETTMDNGNDTNGIGGDESVTQNESRVVDDGNTVMDDAKRAGKDLMDGAKNAADDMMQGEKNAIQDAGDGIRNAADEMKN